MVISTIRIGKIIIWFLLILFFIETAYAADGSSGWHIPAPCFGCHEGIQMGDDDCQGCHKYKLNVEKLESEHNPNICTSCHMGNTLVEANERDIFHRGHNAVSCTQCHSVDNATVITAKDSGFVCVSCHSSKVHSIHIENLGENCPLCHGTWAEGRYISSSPVAEPETNRLGQFTLFALLKNLINALLGV